MKGETETYFQSARQFTKDVLTQLRADGYRYVKVKGYTLDKRPDYIDPYYILLVPVKEAQTGKGTLEIYEAIDSPILNGWAEGDTGTKVLVASIRHR
jgi:hypothetical protein